MLEATDASKYYRAPGGVELLDHTYGYVARHAARTFSCDFCGRVVVLDERRPENLCPGCLAGNEFAGFEVVDASAVLPDNAAAVESRNAEVLRRNAAHDRRPEILDVPLAPGRTVMALDRENYGVVIETRPHLLVNGAGWVLVLFVNNQRETSAEVEMPIYQLVVVR